MHPKMVKIPRRRAVPSIKAGGFGILPEWEKISISDSQDLITPGMIPII
jgi:hypothetical protein